MLCNHNFGECDYSVVVNTTYKLSLIELHLCETVLQSALCDGTKKQQQFYTVINKGASLHSVKCMPDCMCDFLHNQINWHT